MAILDCYVEGCPFRTPDTTDANGAVIMGHHLSSAHRPVPEAGAGGQDRSKLRLEKPKLCGGATSEDWSHFERDWATYKDICRVTDESQAKKVLFECCEQGLKHLMYGQYTSAQQEAATERELLDAMKRLAVVYESALTHRLRMSDAVQSPGQNIHGYLAVLRSLARPCNLTVTCTCTLVVDYSDSVVKDQLIRGMSDDMDRQRLLAEPRSEDVTLEQVVTFLHSIVFVLPPRLCRI